MIKSKRGSGIDIIGDASWGMHFCQFYQTKEDLMDLLVPYFKAGLENNEFCMWVTSRPLSAEDAKEALRVVVPDIDVYLEKGQIEIIPYTEWYVKDDSFDSERVLNGWIEKLNQALANGYEGLRLTGNTFWLEKEDWNDFVNYEKEVDRILGNYQMIALCTYSLDKCNATEIIDIVNNHQFALIKREGKWEQMESSKLKKAEEIATLQSLQRKKEEQKRRRVNNALRESERRYRLLFENMLDGFAYCKMLYDDCGHPVDFIYLDANRAFEQLTGLKEVKGKRATELFPGIRESHPELFDIYGRVELTGQPERFEIDFKPLGMWFSISVYSVEREHFVAVFDDITDRKCIEEALLKSEQHYRLLYETMFQGVVYQDADGKIISVNPAAERIFGKTQAEFLGSSFEGEEHDIIREDGSPFPGFEHPAMVSLRTGQEVQNIVMGVYNPRENCYRWININAVPLFRTGENKPFQVYTLFDDITQRKCTEDAIKKSRFILAKSQEMAHVGNWAWNVQTGEINGSDENYRIYGYKPGDVRPSEDWAMTRTHPDDRALLADFIQSVKRDGMRKSVDYRIVRRDGDTRYVTTFASKIVRDEAGEVKWVYGITQDITERKRAEEEVKDASNMLQLIMNNIPQGIFWKDRNSVYMGCNKVFAKAAGVESPENIVGKNDYDLPWSCEQTEWFLEYDRRIMDNDIPEYHIVEPQWKADGELAWVETNKIPLHDAKSNVIGILGTYEDITERKRAEEALKKAHDNLEEKVKERTAELEKAFNSLKESEERLAEAQNIAHIGNWERNLVTGDLYWSNEMYNIFGHNPQEGVPDYKVLLNYIHPEDRDYMDKTIKRALNGESYSTDHRIISHDGEERTVHVQAEVVFDEKNIPVRIRGIVQDITERKKAEKTILAKEAELQLIADLTPILLNRFSRDLHYVYVNRACEEMFGLTREEIIGKPIVEIVGKEAFETIRPYIEKVLQGQRVEYETEIPYQGVSPRFMHVVYIPERNVHGEVVGWLASVSDITERKKAEENLAKMEIARKKEIHHRIKNNLQVISSLLDLQAEQFKNKEDIKDSEILEAFKESQDRVISMALIHEELYKGGGFETLNFSLYIEELVENLFQTYSVGNNNLSLKLNLAKNILFNLDIAVPLGMIVNELVTNSLKHAFKGKDRGEIRIRLNREENGECIRSINKDCSTSFALTISDDGIGIPEDLEIENLDSLGLQLVTTLVDQLDGELELKRNNGTEFIIKFTVMEKSNQASTPQFIE